MPSRSAANIARETPLLPGEAAQVVSNITGRPITADAVRYHEFKGRLASTRTAGGVRLYRYGDVCDFAMRLREPDDVEDLAS